MINYQLEMEKIIDSNLKQNKVPTLLLHSCCAPCSSSVLEQLSKYFKITIFYYNPNITDELEYQKRVLEQKKFISMIDVFNPLSFIEGSYNPKVFFSAIKGLEELGEGSERCFKCYRLRLEETAKKAKELKFDYFTTTLSISPYKNSKILNEIGYELEKQYDIDYLCADFKKKDGYKRSIYLSTKYNLYRQDYCGCIYSKIEKDKRIKVGE